MQTETVCHVCEGQGYTRTDGAWRDAARPDYGWNWIFKLHCYACNGTGRVPERKEEDHAR